MTDYYKTLGVARTATQDEIKRAFRKLASQHHPDKGGDTAVYQDIQRAYDTLSNDQKRAQYDNPQQHFGGFRGGAAHFDFQNIFDMFGVGGGFQQHVHQARQRAQMTLWITLADSAQGGVRTVTLGTQHGTSAVDIEIPQGIDDGDSVQYSGIHPGGGDIIITFRIHPNPRFQRQGTNLITELALPVWDLILGSNAQVKDIHGNTLEVTIPASTQPGTVLRLKGRGLVRRNVPTGDLLVRIQATIPDNIDPELLALIEQKRNK